MSSEVKESSKSTVERLVPVLLVVSVVLAFMVGILWEKVNTLSGGKAKVSDTNQAAGNVAGAQPEIAEGKLTSEQAKKVPGVSEKDRVKGSRDAKVFLIEYSDLECPFCKRFHPTAQQIVNEYKDVAWVYRHFPLDAIHSKARPEAEASECAFSLGGEAGFWKFIDKIYEVTPANNGLNLDDIPKLASEVGLDEAKMKACISENKFKDRVEADYQGGLNAGVTGTPANFIVNKKGDVWLVPGAVPYETLKKAIDEALAS